MIRLLKKLKVVEGVEDGMFNEVCIYEAKINRQDEREELLK